MCTMYKYEVILIHSSETGNSNSAMSSFAVDHSLFKSSNPQVESTGDLIPANNTSVCLNSHHGLKCHIELHDIHQDNICCSHAYALITDLFPQECTLTNQSCSIKNKSYRQAEEATPLDW